MLSRLKRFLRNWLIDDLDDFWLEIITEEGLAKAEAIAAAGAFLKCRRKLHDYEETLLVGRKHALNEQRFDELLQRLRKPSKAVWEDGSPADLSQF